MAIVDGGELVGRMLVREGVKQVYALHGGHIDTIFQACVDHGIKIYDTRHEQAAGHMADAYARLTGHPGVVLVTAGPGVHAEFVTRAEDIAPVLERAFASGRPACVNVMTDPAVISPMVLATTSPAARPRPVPQGLR
jgi:acetolactate synthase-1/2/3 large subunit